MNILKGVTYTYIDYTVFNLIPIEKKPVNGIHDINSGDILIIKDYDWSIFKIVYDIAGEATVHGKWSEPLLISFKMLDDIVKKDNYFKLIG